jgi:uncharacterized membrane protein
MSTIQNKFSRRAVALFWVSIIAVVISILIYFEMIPILYVLATLALVVLLLVVGFSNLEDVGRENIEGFAAKEE